MKRVGFFLFSLVCCAAVHAAELSPLDELSAAARSYDEQALSDLAEKLAAAADKQPESHEAQRAAAECFLIRAALNQNDRKIRKLPGKEEKAKHAQQVAWGNQGIPYAERALALAKSDAEKAHANRLIGELYSHLITGPITGYKYGSISLSHIEAALELTPDDPECIRAKGMMYLHNPPFSGGDAKKAIETFTRCAKLNPKNDQYQVLLAMAHRKKEQMDEARAAAAQALTLNPSNRDAKNLIALLKK